MKTKMLILGPWMLLAGLLVGTPAAQAGTLPPTLSGETFTADQGPGDAVLSCNSDGSGSFTLHATGTATGPYPGTFVEDTTVTNAAPSPDGSLLTYHATFTITSSAGTVTGTKDLVPGSHGTAACQTHRFRGGYFGADSVTYSATIVSAGYTYADSGTATATDYVGGRPVRVPQEHFLTSNGLAPTAKDQCKDDGWMDYPQFKNQGQCIAYVNHQAQS